jgi:D-amino-acid dehydrogenase
MDTPVDPGPDATRRDVVIIGGGAVGLACAVSLLETGRAVTVLDTGAIGRGSSHGNCGTLTPSHAAPLAAPGTLRKALRWMLTPDAPFYVRPRVDPALWRWMARFAARCNQRNWLETMRPKAAILQASRGLFPQWIDRYALDCEFAPSGVDYVFRTREAFDGFARELEPLRAHGIEAETIDGAAYQRAEPALKEGTVAAAVRFPGDARLRPDRYVAELARVVRARGGIIEEQCAAEGIAAQRGGVSVMTARGERFARDVVVATGAWTPQFARSAGLSALPIQPGKGYSITYDAMPAPPRRPLVLYERSVCVTAWDSGFRLGSTMEFSGYDSSLNRRRIRALERGASEYLRTMPGPQRREEWFGWRPLTYDDLPVIGRMPGFRHVWAATGHGMMGIGMSPGTADLLAALMDGREPAIDPVPYSAGRFL